MCNGRILRKKRLQNAYASQHQTQSENSCITIYLSMAMLNESDEESTRLHQKEKNRNIKEFQVAGERNHTQTGVFKSHPRTTSIYLPSLIVI